jgi:thiol-disulfide isomerase/thioredoxin
MNRLLGWCVFPMVGILCLGCTPNPKGKAERQAAREGLTRASLPPNTKEKAEKDPADLIGKTAPEIAGDFTLNDNAFKLSPLKGKVVLLDFWTVQSGACAATLPRLRDWSKAHKDAGLEIIGVTYYPSEMGLRLSFDKQAGKLTSVEEATMTSDEAMFTAIAAYHKLDYVLLTLHKRNALNTFDAYAVNGVPQLVLIDRNGIVRFIRAGEVDVNTGAVESELKTLLAEK